jgi:hypothetical protein
MPITTRPWSFRYKEVPVCRGWPWSNNAKISKIAAVLEYGQSCRCGSISWRIDRVHNISNCQGVALIETPGSGFKMPGANMVCTTFEGVDRDDDSENFS